MQRSHDVDKRPCFLFFLSFSPGSTSIFFFFAHGILVCDGDAHCTNVTKRLENLDPGSGTVDGKIALLGAENSLNLVRES